MNKCIRIRILKDIFRGGHEYKKNQIITVMDCSHGLEVYDDGFFPGSLFKEEEVGEIWTYNLAYSPFEDSMEYHEKMA